MKTWVVYPIPPKMVIERRFQDIHSNFLEIVVNKKGIKFGSDFFSWNYTFETPIKAVRSGYKVQWVDFISEVAFQGYDCASLFSPKNSFQFAHQKLFCVLWSLNVFPIQNRESAFIETKYSSYILVPFFTALCHSKLLF